MLAGFASLWTLNTTAWSLTETDNAGTNYYFQNVKGLKAGGPLVTFDTFTCDKNPSATTASFVEHEYVSSTGHQMLPIPGSPEHIVHKYKRKTQTTYLVVPARDTVNWVCQNESQKSLFLRKVVYSKQLEEKEKEKKLEESYWDMLNNLLKSSDNKAYEEVAQIFSNLKSGESLSSMGRDSSAAKPDTGDGGGMFGGGPRPDDDDSKPSGPSLDSEKDDQDISILAQYLLGEKMFGTTDQSGVLVGEHISGSPKIKKEKNGKGAGRPVSMYFSSTTPSSTNTPENVDNQPTIVEVTANTVEQNLNIIQLGLLLGGVPITDDLHMQLLDISDMSAAELENLATIFENLSLNAPELMADGDLSFNDLSPDEVVELLLRIEYFINEIKNVREREESDGAQLSDLALIRRNLIVAIGVRLSDQVLNTMPVLAEQDKDHQEAAIVGSLLVDTSPLSPPPPPEDEIQEDINNLKDAIEVGEISPENIEWLKLKITILRKMIESIRAKASDDQQEKWRELEAHLQNLEDNLVQYQQGLGAQFTSHESLSSWEEHVYQLEQNIVRLDRLKEKREQDLEEATPGSARAKTLMNRIQSLSTLRSEAAGNLVELIKSKPEKGSPDATPEPADMNGQETKEVTTFNKSKLKSSEGATGGSGNREDEDEDEEDDLPQRGQGGGRGNGGGVRRVDMAQNTSERKMKELVMWIAKNLENLNTGDEAKLSGADAIVQKIFAEIVIKPESMRALQRLIKDFLEKEYPEDADRLLTEAQGSLKGEGVEFSDDVFAYIRVMMRVKRTLKLSMMLMEEGITSQKYLQEVKKTYSMVLGGTFKVIDKVTFVDNPEWVVSATHNGEDLLSSEVNRELMLKRIMDTDFAQLTEPEAIKEAEPVGAWAEFLRDASRTPYSFTYVVGTTRADGVFNITRSYPLFNAKKQWADMSARFPDRSDIQKISVEGGITDTLTLFFSKNQRVLGFLTKLINQNTANLIKNIIFGGTGSVSVGGGFVEQEGVLTQMGLGQMHGMNYLHNDLDASDVQVTVYSNGVVRLEYSVQFDRWSFQRKATKDDTFKGDFKMTVAMDFDESGRRKRAEFSYEGGISQSEQSKADIMREAFEQQVRESELKKLEKTLTDLLNDKKRNSTKSNNWQHLDDFEAVVLDMGNPEQWHYHPDVVGVASVFQDYAGVLKIMKKYDLYSNPKYKKYKKKLNEMQERFETVFQKYLGYHQKAYTQLLENRVVSPHDEVESVFAQYSGFQQSVLSEGATIAQLGRSFKKIPVPNVAKIASQRARLIKQLDKLDGYHERLNSHAGDLSKARFELISNRSLKLSGDELNLVNRHLPIIISGLQVEAFHMLRSTQ